MPQPIEFWFDFSSPYGYLAAQKIDKLAENHRRSASWRPFLLGAVFKVTGSRPLIEFPLKGAYSKRDMERSAREIGVPFQLPAKFPFLSVAAARGFYFIDATDPGKARAYAKAVYHRIFGEGQPPETGEQAAELGPKVGVDAQALLAGINDQAIKDKLRTETDRAIAAGVFGSPFFIVDGEPFWGHDRLEQIDRWLETGGW
ncbi:MAG: 2-hydroxychromene-2-carboxylate isomerase [Alphaproteobacteria bacterium]|nr:2-hydroxychromene-2-carboxylate isomerase [Alphaproteobacteria bacterium]